MNNTKYGITVDLLSILCRVTIAVEMSIANHLCGSHWIYAFPYVHSAYIVVEPSDMEAIVNVTVAL